MGLRSRRMVAASMSVAVLAGLVLLAGPASAATCRVRNVRTDATTSGHGSNLQQAIDGAEQGDTLVLRGLCVGNFVLTTDLHLRGRPTDHIPIATLDADGTGHVLVSEGSARLEDLVLQGGRAQRGGGILHTGGKLTLAGDTTIRRNVAKSGGGIYDRDGAVVLTDSADVRANLADIGGGIVVVTAKKGGSLVLKDASSIRGNRARSDGGGLYSAIGVVRMKGHASIRGNVAGRHGGGFADYDGSAELRGYASIVQNVARRRGGGYAGFFASLRICSDHVRLSPNDPDDGPDIDAERC